MTKSAYICFPETLRKSLFHISVSYHVTFHKILIKTREEQKFEEKKRTKKYNKHEFNRKIQSLQILYKSKKYLLTPS